MNTVLTRSSVFSPTFGSRANKQFAVGLLRAFAGAMIFSLPMLMTMEMWYLGFYMAPERFALFTALIIPLLVGLSHFLGFEPTFCWQDDVVDAFVAYAVGVITSVVILLLIGVLGPGMSAGEIVGKIGLQAISGSIGGLLAQSELGSNKEEEQEKIWEAGYFGELFLMSVGTLFLALNLAPTEEMILIGYKMTPWHASALVVFSLVVMHAFVYMAEFEGQASVAEGDSEWGVFLRFTVVGYAMALLISFYILWVFGRTDDVAFAETIVAVIVLSFPASIGAAAARLIL